VVNAGVVELEKKPIAVVEHCMQDVAIDAFSKQLGRMQGSGVRKETIVCNCLYEFWQKAATAKIIRDGHLTIYELLASYKEYLTIKLYDDLMMLYKFELELLTNVTVVPLLTDINEMDNIQCNFYCYKCEKFIGKDLGGFALNKVATKKNKPLVLKSFLKEDNWSLASMCLCLVHSSSINLASDVHLTDKYKKVIKAGVVELGKEKMLLWNILHSKLLLMPLSSNLDYCRTVVLVRKELQVIVWVHFEGRQQLQRLCVMGM
jgi:hypothetical protein